MGYTDEKQEIKPALRKIVDGIIDFDDAVDARMEAGTTEWNFEHLTQISDLRKRLVEFKGEIQLLLNS